MNFGRCAQNSRWPANCTGYGQRCYGANVVLFKEVSEQGANRVSQNFLETGSTGPMRSWSSLCQEIDFDPIWRLIFDGRLEWSNKRKSDLARVLNAINGSEASRQINFPGFNTLKCDSHAASDHKKSVESIV